MEITDSYSKIFKDTKRILTVFAHPDDQEIVCGGLVARLTKDGKEVKSIVMTNGGKGMRDRTDVDEKTFGQMRSVEQKKAGEILGIKETLLLDIPDGEVEGDLNTIGKIVRVIREFRPDVVITHNPHDFYIHFFDKSSWINHRDHRKTGEVVFDAVYPYSRDNGFFPEHIKEGLKSFDVSVVLTADSYTSPDLLYFDITDCEEVKLKALQTHKTSFDDEMAEEFAEENKIGDRYFETLGLCKAD